MKTLSQLTDFYYATLYPSILELEETRKQLLKKISLYAVFLGIFTFFLFYIATDSLKHVTILAASLAIAFFLGVGSFFYKFLTQDFTDGFKIKVIKPLIHEIGDQLSYEPLSMMPLELFKTSELFTQPIDRYEGADFVTGTIDDVKISFSFLHVKTEEKDSKNQKRDVTIFQGLFIAIPFNKYFKNSTIILPDKAQNIFGSLIGNLMQSYNFQRPQLIKMDDPEFEKEFVVYGTDQIEARYILSHSMMQRVLELKKRVGKPVYLSFKNGMVFIAIDYRKDLFTPSLFRSFLEYKVALEYIQSLQMTLAIVQELKLNENLWSKW